jgi:hypothetical protein
LKFANKVMSITSKAPADPLPSRPLLHVLLPRFLVMGGAVHDPSETPVTS